MNDMTLPPDTGFEIPAVVVSDRACYRTVTEAPHSLRVIGEETCV